MGSDSLTYVFNMGVQVIRFKSNEYLQYASLLAHNQINRIAVKNIIYHSNPVYFLIHIFEKAGNLTPIFFGQFRSL